MTWWTSIPSLSPVAAWDAISYDAVGLIDRVGTNKLAWANPEEVPFGIRGVKGKGVVANLQSLITLPAQYTLLVFMRPTARTVMFSRSNTAQSAVRQETAGQHFTRNDANAQTELAGSSPFGSVSCIALTRGAAAVSYFLNGAALSTTIPLAHCPDFLGRVTGWRDGDPDYSIRPEGEFYAAGVWVGAATLAQVQSLEATLRVFLQGVPGTFRGLAATTGRAGNPPPEALTPFGPVSRARGAHAVSFAPSFAGVGVVRGTVKEKNQPANTPLRRKVQLIDATTSILLREVWSDALTGNYVFVGLALNVPYTVISYDHTGLYRAVIADQQTPVVLGNS